MYIETALKRLNAFKADDDERYSFPDTYKSEPYRGYNWEEILAMARCLPSIPVGDACVEIPELSIKICLANRTVVETKAGYTLVSHFNGDTRNPAFILCNSEGQIVYTRSISDDIEISSSTHLVIGGSVMEEWKFPDNHENTPSSIKQWYTIKDAPKGSGVLLGNITTTYTIMDRHVAYGAYRYEVVENGEVKRYSYGSDGLYYNPYKYTISRDSNLLASARLTASRNCATMLTLFDKEGVGRKYYDGTTETWYDQNDRLVEKGRLNFLTHSYEVEMHKAKDAIRESGAIKFDTSYLGVRDEFHLDACAEFPLEQPERSDEESPENNKG